MRIFQLSSSLLAIGLLFSTVQSVQSDDFTYPGYPMKVEQEPIQIFVDPQDPRVQAVFLRTKQDPQSHEESAIPEQRPWKKTRLNEPGK